MATELLEEVAELEADPNSTAEFVIKGFPSPVDGEEMTVDPRLIARPPYQRSLSETWVKARAKELFNPALGYGIVLNKVSLEKHRSRDAADVDLDAVQYALSLGLDYVLEVIIGQHRSELSGKLGIASIRALVLDNVSDDEAALLFVHDARTARPLRGFDMHRASLIRHEPRAMVIQETLDSLGIELVASGLKDGKVSCIRALEKVCGKHVEAPDKEALDWCLRVLMLAFPKAKWSDPMVHGLSIARKAWLRDNTPVPDPKKLGSAAHRKWKGDTKQFTDSVREAGKTMTSPQPTIAANMWDILKLTLGDKSSKFDGLD